MARPKTVFTTSELPHIWAHQSAPEGRCPSHFSFLGKVIFSYNVAIGEIVEHPETGENFYLVNASSYSSSTASHISGVRSAIPHDSRRFQIEGPSRWGYSRSLQQGLSLQEIGQKIVDRLVAIAQEQWDKSTRARQNKAWLLEGCVGNYDEACSAAEFFRIAPPEIPAQIELARTQIEAVREEQEKLQRQRDAAQAEKERVGLERWKNGENVNRSFSASPISLRLNPRDDREIETSRGARISVEAAQRLWGFLKTRRGQQWRSGAESFKLDNYSLNAVNNEGIVVGCHRIGWDEIDRFAQVLGW